MNTTLAGIIKACSDLENRTHFHELEEGHWVFMGEPSNPIIHLEETCVNDYILIHSSLSKTGEDAMITSFLTWLFEEDSHASSPDGIGVWSNRKAVNYFIKRSICHLTPRGLIQLLDNFALNLSLKGFAIQHMQDEVKEDDSIERFISVAKGA